MCVRACVRASAGVDNKINGISLTQVRIKTRSENYDRDSVRLDETRFNHPQSLQTWGLCCSDTAAAIHSLYRPYLGLLLGSLIL